MKRTGIFATAEDVEELQKLADEAKSTPVMVIGDMDISERPIERMYDRCHEIALGHGLPEIPGFYGVTSDGEFVRY